MQEITVVGGGVAGLVAAIHVAEQGGRILLHEASGTLGGRARTQPGSYRVNVGPHALYRYGAFEAWLLGRQLLPRVTWPSLTGLRLLDRGDRLRRIPSPLLPMLRLSRRPAPVDRDYRSWACAQIGTDATEAAVGFASLPTFHGDPGTLSAAFVQERIVRSLGRRPVYYVIGGWSALVDSLAVRARSLGVEIVTGSKLTAVPADPTIVATDLSAAARLLGDASLTWPCARTALFDVALSQRRGDPSGVLDLGRRVYASCYNARDASLAPVGEDLLQVAAGLRDGETREAAQARIEATLDRSHPNWRARVRWQRRAFSEGGAGPADPPGSTWRDRPAIERGDDVWLAGDRVAAPGVLSEVAFASAREAADRALARVRVPGSRRRATTEASSGGQRAATAVTLSETICSNSSRSSSGMTRGGVM